MHYSIEEGKRINFIDEVILPSECIRYVRENAKRTGRTPTGGMNKDRDYNHSTFIDLVLRGVCGVDVDSKVLSLSPKIQGTCKWFKLENLTLRKQTYTVYYDENGTVFRKGKGVRIEKQINT